MKDIDFNKIIETLRGTELVKPEDTSEDVLSAIGSFSSSLKWAREERARAKHEEKESAMCCREGDITLKPRC